MQNGKLLDQVVEAIVVVTRYPKEVLAPEADLENDLGIDSVKLVEILVALGKEFHLELVNQERDPAIRTIGQVAEWIDQLLIGKGTHQNRSVRAVANFPQAARSWPIPLHKSVPSPAVMSAPSASAQDHHHKSALMATQPMVMEHVAMELTPRERRDNGRSINGGFTRVSPAHPATAPVHASDRRDSTSAPQEDTIPVQPASLRGRVALITGSGRGVGRTIARLLAKRGATVIVNSFHSRDAGESTTAEILAEGGQAIHLWGSVANSGHVDNIFDEIGHRHGHLDILVCNASDGRIGSFAEISPEDWERAFRTNVTGHYQCAMRACRLMQRRGGGSIVTMSSIAARRHVEGLGGQGVVKAAVESLTRHLACELAPLGIRANCVSGGPVYGQVMSSYPEARTTLNYWETLVLDGELCSPMDLASTVAFLVSDEARGVNGAVWNVDHGLSTRSHSRPLPKPMSDHSNTALS